MDPERRAILAACQSPQSVAEAATALGLPLNVVKILIDDLVEKRLVTSRRPYRAVADQDLLRTWRRAVAQL